MSEWTRRRVLLAALGIGSVASGVVEQTRRRRLALEQAQLSREFLSDPQIVSNAVTQAIEGDREAAAEMASIVAQLDLRLPEVPYDRAVSQTLIQASRLATEQYLTGKFDLSYDGGIQRLPAYTNRLDAYRQVASIKGPETVNAERQLFSDDQEGSDRLLAQTNRIRRLINRAAGRSLVVRWSFPVYWGFVLTGPEHHVLVLRGTQRGHEWMQTLRANQVTSTEVSAFDFPGRIHSGFAGIYARLSRPLINAVQQLDPSKPLYISGHSLGSPLATLAALDISQKLPALRDQLRLYSYAGPRLGDPEFAESFTRAIPNCYRVVNLADLVPTLPPSRTGDIVYVHLGETWQFTSASGDIGPNHFISAYSAAINKQLEQPAADPDRVAG